MIEMHFPISHRLIEEPVALEILNDECQAGRERGNNHKTMVPVPNARVCVCGWNGWAQITRVFRFHSAVMPKSEFL